jgi:transposase
VSRSFELSLKPGEPKAHGDAAVTDNLAQLLLGLPVPQTAAKGPGGRFWRGLLGLAGRSRSSRIARSSGRQPYASSSDTSYGSACKAGGCRRASGRAHGRLAGRPSNTARQTSSLVSDRHRAEPGLPRFQQESSRKGPICRHFYPRHPDRVTADRAYDHKPQRRELRKRGIAAEIARRKTEHGSGVGRYRWVVERTFAWLHQFKRLLVRYDRRADIHEAFLALGCCLVCYRRLKNASL